jgi:hypothetical protein
MKVECRSSFSLAGAKEKPTSAWTGGGLQVTSLLFGSQCAKSKIPLQQGWEAGSW